MNSDLLNLIKNPAQGPAEPVTHAVPVEEVRPGDVVVTPAGLVFVLNTEAGDALGPWLTVECLNTGTPRWLRPIAGELADVIRHY